MKVLLQRVTHAQVRVDGETVGEIGRGLLAFVGVEKGDDHDTADALVRRLLGYRIFPDAEGKMNLGVRDIGGAVLAVSQFTLAADTRKGMRPSFSSAAPPAEGEQLYDYFVQRLRDSGVETATGSFGADMQVSLVNDGPVTFLLERRPPEVQGN